MIGRVNQPRDLVWSLESFSSPDNAMTFFNSFKNSFVIYSSSVQKLYAEYNTHLTGPKGRQRMVVLPDFNQFDSIFNKVPDSAIVDTSIIIYPHIKNGKSFLVLAGCAKASGKTEKFPLRKGLKALKMGYFEDDVVAPALMLGDLREFPEKRLPYLRLHSVQTRNLNQSSDFEKSDIQKGTWAKLSEIL